MIPLVSSFGAWLLPTQWLLSSRSSCREFSDFYVSLSSFELNQLESSIYEWRFVPRIAAFLQPSQLSWHRQINYEIHLYTWGSFTLKSIKVSGGYRAKVNRNISRSIRFLHSCELWPVMHLTCKYLHIIRKTQNTSVEGQIFLLSNAHLPAYISGKFAQEPIHMHARNGKWSQRERVGIRLKLSTGLLLLLGKQRWAHFLFSWLGMINLVQQSICLEIPH